MTIFLKCKWDIKWNDQNCIQHLYDIERALWVEKFNFYLNLMHKQFKIAIVPIYNIKKAFEN